MTRGSFSIEAMLVARTVPETLKDGSTTICSIWLCPPLAHDCLLRVYPLRLEHKIKAWDVCRLFLTRSERDSREYTYKLAAAPVLIRHGNRQEVRPLVEQLAGINGGVTVKRLDDQRKSMGVIAPDLYKYVVKRVRGEQRPGLIFEDADGSHNLQIKEWGVHRLLSRPQYGVDDVERALHIDVPSAERRQYLVVGNLRDHRKTWVIVHVLGYSIGQTALLPAPVPDARRVAIFERDECCQGCGTDEDLSIDHRIPRSRGGSDEGDNLWVLCRSCNSSKGDQTDEEWLSKPLVGQATLRDETAS
jgi:hypothetical protein